MPTPSETISEYFGALRAMDAARWTATFALTATTNDPVGTPPKTGHEAILAFATGIFSLFTTFGLTENSIFPAGNTYAVKWTAAGTGKNGASVTFEGIDVITLNDDAKIILVDAYWDPTPVLAAVTA